MARPKRNAARQCNDKMKRALEEELLDKSMCDDDDNVVIATASSSSASDAETNPFLRRGRSRRSLDVLEETARKLWALGPSPLKPQTPQKTSVLTKRPRARPMEVVEIESDSSDEFVVDDQSSDDDISDVGRGLRKVEVEVLDTDSDEMEARPRCGRGKNPPSKRVKRMSRGRRAVQDSAPKLQWQVSDEEWDEQWGNATDADFNALKLRKLPLEQGEAPAELLMPLLPFQKEWLAWSLKQEAGIMRGGILADEMGMGKTIQAISLIVAGRCREPVPPKVEVNIPVSSDHASNSLSSQTPLPQVKATLVICPLVAVIQWRNEVQRFTAAGSVKVLVYHGPRRSIGLDVLAGYDIILTTYSTLEVEHRKHVLPPKDPCKWCGKLYYAERMAIHLRYYCGPEANRTSKQAKQEKRKATPKLHSKVVDIKDSETDSEVDVVKRKGPKKGRCVKSAKKKCIADIDEDLEMSEGQVSSKSKSGRGCYRKIAAVQLQDALGKAVDTAARLEMASTSKKLQGTSILHSVRWQRIVLDEAHSIKDRKSSTAKAAFALQAEYKWALSGTPLQNRVGELYSLIRFLGIHPFSYYFCRKCECKSLDYQFQVYGQKNACSCGHSPLHHFCWWNKFVANPIKRKGYVEEGQKAMRILKQKVLSSTLLRRTKLERAADLALPPRTAFLRRDMFDAREQDFYQALYTQSQSQFNGYVTAGTLVNNYAHIFDLLTRLRQAVDHPYLVVYSATSIKDAPQFELSGGDSVCGLCHESAEDPLTSGCQHSFCRLCIDRYIAAAELSSQCPKCQKLLTIDFIGTKASKSGHAQHPRETGVRKSSILNRIDLRQFQTSTKIEAVKEEIYFMLKKDPAAKAIIFSQFTSMLDLIGFSLKKSGIRYVKLDGSMNLAARDQMIEAFTNDVDTKIFLMSLKAGGVALNLTVASHVFLMDPWWNPAVEQQAQDRIHRIGQYKPIRVTRFVIENTIEERILKLQEKKQLVFEGTVGGSSDALGRLTEEDLRFLFTN